VDYDMVYHPKLAWMEVTETAQPVLIAATLTF